jgi:hypothetical protein
LGFYQDTEIGSVYGPLIASTTSTYLADDADTGIATGHAGKFIFKAPGAVRKFQCVQTTYSQDPSGYLGRIVLDLGLGNGVNNNVNGGAVANRIHVTPAENQQCTDVTINIPMPGASIPALGGGSFSTATCTSAGFETYVHAQEAAGWPHLSSTIVVALLTAQQILDGYPYAAPQQPAAQMFAALYAKYKDINSCPAWEYTG